MLGIVVENICDATSKVWYFEVDRIVVFGISFAVSYCTSTVTARVSNAVVYNVLSFLVSLSESLTRTSSFQRRAEP